MIKIDNQPVNFESDPFQNPWVSEAKYKQLVNQGDITQFQFLTTTQNNSENLLTNPGFDVSTAGWVVTAGEGLSVTDGLLRYYQETDKTGIIIYQNNVLTVGSYYYVELQIKKAVNGYVRVKTGNEVVGNLQAGNHIRYAQCTNNQKFSIEFVPFANDLATEIIIDYAIVYDTPIANHRFTIQDLDGTQVAEIPAVADYLAAPFAPDTTVAQFVKQYLTMSIDWQTQGISNGCYRIGVCDGDLSTNAQCGVINSEFEAPTGVGYGETFDTPTGSFGWSISLGGSMTLTNLNTAIRFNSTAVETGVLTQSVLKSGTTYNYAIQIIGSTGEDIDVIAGTQTNSHTATGGTDTFTGTITADGTDLKLQFVSTAGSKSMTLNYFRIEAQNADLEPDYLSNPFWLDSDHDRTVVINTSNSNDALGFEFDETEWSPRLRMKGYLAPSDNPYTNDRQSLTTSVGNRKNYYLKRRKSRVLVVDQEPEFIHDWLSLLVGFDHVYIDNNEYFIDDDEYNPIVWDKLRIKGATEINVSTKIQDIKKTRTIPERNGFTIADNVDGTTTGIIVGPEQIGNVKQTGNIGLADPSDLSGNTVVQANNSTNENESIKDNVN